MSATTALVLLFLVVFVLNVMPAFAPPTWMAMSLFGFNHPEADAWLVAFVAASSATAGRFVLARCAKRIAQARWVALAMRDNLTAVAELIDRRRATSIAAFLVFAFSPLPSNVLFLAFGLTGAPLRLLTVPFFIGRFFSYAAAFAGGSVVSRRIDVELSGAGSWAYFALTQIAMLALVYAFTRIDWRRLLGERRLRWLS